jgi:hypothetical protein
MSSLSASILMHRAGRGFRRARLVVLSMFLPTAILTEMAEHL